MDHKIIINISPSPVELKKEYDTIFNEESLMFVAKLHIEFRNKIKQLYLNRLKRNEYYQKNNDTPKFENSQCKKIHWKITQIPTRLRNRRIDLGDVSPSNTIQFFESLKQDVQGVQVDFDDGHCPNWHNQILGHYNIHSAIHNNTRNIKNMPIMMLRPRAWNMIEHNVVVNGEKLPGALLDFGLLMFHNAIMFHTNDSGPYFYLSKLESGNEAKLWNEIFIWTQQKLGLPFGTIKCCVLIENILATFELDEMLYELRDHCIGLNCGMWDYIASIIAKFGNRKDFLLADRQKLSMKDRFLKTYMDLIIQTCHNRGALATGGMVAKILSSEENSISQIGEMKRFEIDSGIDGFLIYDLNLIPHVKKLWEESKDFTLSIPKILESSEIETDLLTLPSGTVTQIGLTHNIQVTVLFVYHWLQGIGHFVHNGFIEDSATAEISRSQIWQWLKHRVQLIYNNEIILISPQLVEREITEFKDKNRTGVDRFKMDLSSNIATELFLAQTYPDFITTYLNNHPKLHMKYESPKTKL